MVDREGGDRRLFETMRVRSGGIPLLGKHVARLEASCGALGLAAPGAVAEAAAERAAVVEDDAVLRVSWDGEQLQWEVRPYRQIGAIDVWLVASDYGGYPHKVEARRVFEEAEAVAHEHGADEPLLVTSDGWVAEAARFAVAWLDGEVVRTASAALHVLPGVGLHRLLELLGRHRVGNEPGHYSARDLAGRSIVLVNAVRGIVPVRTVDGRSAPVDDRWEAWHRSFWPG
jgi:branched-subunit amino acid aminotransferase/4-amino-4-deoxychorismate lyase